MNGEVKKKITLFIVVGVLLILTLTGGLVYFLLNKDKSPSINKDSVYLYDVNIESNVIKVYTDKILYNNEDVEYSQENVDKFINFIKNNYNVKDKSLTINYAELDEYQAMIMLCFINNLSEAEFEVAVEEYKYSVFLSDKNGYYIIYLKDDNKIHVKKVKTSYDKLDISMVTNTYDINFSRENNAKLVSYIESLFYDDTEIRQIYKSTIRKDEENIVNSIIKNDESYLNKKSAKLLYTMGYSGIDCLTPTLYLYSDNTFEYYYTFSTDNSILVPKKGTYDVNINDLIAESSDTLDYSVGIYSLLDVSNNKVYYINITSSTARELLSKANVNLSTCLVQQGYEA